MKNLLVLLFITVSFFVQAQDKFADLESKHNFLPVMNIGFLPGKASTFFPKYVDGRAGLNTFIESEISYPEEAKNQKIEGTVIISYTINKKGKLTAANKTKEGFQNDLLINELIRVVEKSGPWIPAKIRNKYKKMTMQVSYEFSL